MFLFVFQYTDYQLGDENISIENELSTNIFTNTNLPSGNLLSIFNYEKAMINSSYAFDFSRLINHETSGNFYQNAIRDSRFLYPENYISREKIQKCLINNSQDFCLVKNNITQIISGPEFLLDKQNFNCEKKFFITGARNPLNRIKREVEVCEKNLSK